MDEYQVFPALTDDAFQALKADIAERGVQIPVEYDTDGNLLDGHHRVRACRELGIRSYPRIVRSFTSETEKLEHVATLNLQRRHLTWKDRRLWVEQWLQWRPEWSDRRIAGVVGVDHKTVGAARRRLGGETPHLVEGRDGRMQPRRKQGGALASNRLEQDRVVQALRDLGADGLDRLSSASSAAARARRRTDHSRVRSQADAAPSEQDCDGWRIEHCPVADLTVAPGSVDAVITDPPYPMADLPVWSDLGAFAAEALRPGGYLAAYTGTMALDQVMNLLGEHLEFTGWSVSNGSSRFVSGFGR